MYLRETAFSHFKTFAFLLLIFQSVASFAATAASENRPPVRSHELMTDKDRRDWKKYAELTGTLNRHQMEEEFRFLKNAFVVLGNSPGAFDVLKVLGENRTSLAWPLRWFLAAMEIQNDIIKPETLADARSAVIHTTVLERAIIPLFRHEMAPEIFYYLPGEPSNGALSSIRVQNLGELIYFNKLWQKYFLHVPASEVTEQLETKRLKWYSMLLKAKDYVAFADLTALISAFNDPQMRRFKNKKYQEQFLDESSEFIKQLGFMYGSLQTGHNGQQRFAVEEKHRETYVLMRQLVQSWIHEDLSYTLIKFDRLRRMRLTSLDFLLERKVLPTDRNILMGFLKAKKIDVDSYLIATMMWLKLHGQVSSAETQKIALEAAFSLIMESKPSRNGVFLTLGSVMDSQFMLSTDFERNIINFYKIAKDSKSLDLEMSKKLMKKKTVRTAPMTDEFWLVLERQRYECLEANLPLEIFKEYIVKIVIGETDASLEERFMLAQYLREKMKVPDLDQIGLRLKVKYQGGKIEKYAGTSPAIWSKNDAQLVNLMKQLNPGDVEMHEYLSKIYTGKSFDGPLAGQEALTHIAHSGVGSEEIKTEMLRRLQFATVGDSAGTFSAFLKIYPDEGAEIIEILYRHTKAAEKMKLMLKSLVLEAEANPQILAAIKRDIRTLSNRQAAEFLYMNATLDRWLEFQVERLKAAKAQAGGSCGGKFK